MATGFVKNAHRIDPYKTFKFRVFWDGKPVLGVNKVGALKRTTDVITHREGGENSWDHKTPGRTTYDGLTLERGITHDTEFEKWANLVHSFNGDASMDLVNFRKDLELVLYNERGQAALRYFLYGCWVSEFTALPALDAGENAIAVEQMKIELYGFARDIDTKEPDEAGAVPAA